MQTRGNGGRRGHRVAVAGLDLVVVDANHQRLSSLGDAETCARLSFRTKGH